MSFESNVRQHLRIDMYEERFYRNTFKGMNLTFFNVCILETDLCIGACSDLYEQAYSIAAKYRLQVETYIKDHPDFLTSLSPIEPVPDAPYIITAMCAAACKAGVGPMAAVAGALSEMTGRELLRFSDEVIVENGGDIFISTKTVRKVGIFAGKSPLSEKLVLEIMPEKSPLGLCTSSGTVGHSLSFGKADAALVVSADTLLADAVATALGNRVKSPEDIEAALEFASAIEGVEGALVIIGDRLGAWGDIKLV